MEFPRQPGPVKIIIKGSNIEDVSRAFHLIHRILDNNYASTNCYDLTTSHTLPVETSKGRIIDCYLFAVND